jgi:hypothetical protein
MYKAVHFFKSDRDLILLQECVKFKNVLRVFGSFFLMDNPLKYVNSLKIVTPSQKLCILIFYCLLC